jgi:hypothetical protein
MRALLLPLLLVCACATPSASTTPSSSAKLKPFLATVCESMRADACRPEVKSAAPEDLATIVMGDMGEKEPAFGTFLAESMKGVAPADRKQVITSRIGDVLGTPWTCPAFDAIWANQHPTCP